MQTIINDRCIKGEIDFLPRNIGVRLGDFAFKDHFHATTMFVLTATSLQIPPVMLNQRLTINGY